MFRKFFRCNLLFSLICSVLYVSSALGQSVDKKVKHVVHLINIKNDSLLFTMMSKESKIGDLPYEVTQPILKEVLRNFSSISTYKISSIDSTSGDIRTNLNVTYADGRSGKPAIVFDKDGKIVLLDIIRIRKEVDPVEQQAESLAQVSFPDSIFTKIELINGLIYVPARLNGENGYFMLDSGCPLMMLNSEYLDKTKLDHSTSNSLQGIGGAIGNGTAKGVTVEIGTLSIPNLTAPASSMGDSHSNDGMKMFGLLGYEIFKQYSLILNYQTQEMMLVKRKLGQAVEPIKLGNVVYVSKAVVDVKMQRHIAIVPLAIGDKVYDFGMDCGANANVFKKSIFEDVKSNFDPEEEQVTVTGMGNNNSQAVVGYMMGTKLGNLPLVDMYTVFSDQQIGAGSGTQALQVQGLLGTPFFNQFVTEVDYVNKRFIVY